VTAEELATVLEAPLFEVEEALDRYARRLAIDGPLQMVMIAGGYQLCTKPEYASLVARFLRPQGSKITKALIEVLAIVAYKQPITAAEVEDIRGVNSAYSLKQLQERRMIAEVGRKAGIGRPILYGTTQQFLHTFNLRSIKDLPDAESLTRELGKDENPPLLEYSD
jgi:segregation and condensation protein B